MSDINVSIIILNIKNIIQVFLKSRNQNISVDYVLTTSDIFCMFLWFISYYFLLNNVI